MITTFEDVYIPQKDGKAFVDVSTFDEGRVDTRGKVDELKFMRDQMVASLGVPPAFIGIEENLCLSINSMVYLINGEKKTLKEIIEKYNSNEKLFVYSYDKKSGKVVPGEITWAGYTRLQTKLVRVYLDNDKFIDCTPDHRFYLRDGITEVEAQNLKSGDSLLPFYTRQYKHSKTKRGVYREVYNPGLDSWELICPICETKFGRPKWYLEACKDINNITCASKECFSKVRSQIMKEKYSEPEKKVVYLNHKVVRVEELEGLHDTGDITVEKYHNFAVDAGIIVHNSNKAALSEENILFARTVISHQRYLTHQMNDLIQKVFDIIDPETALSILDFVEVALPVPRSLQFEREASYMSNVANLVEALERIGIPREYSKKKYLSQIDWDEVKKFEISSKIEKSLDPAKAAEDMGMGGMGGGMGGMGGGMGGMGGGMGGGMPPGGEGGFGGGV